MLVVNTAKKKNENIKDEKPDYSEVKNPDIEILEAEMAPASNEMSMMSVLLALISDKTNIELKTEIHKPKEFSIFELYGNYLESEGYPEANEPIAEFVQLYRENMVSFQRGSRKEITKVLSSWIEQYESNSNGNLVIDKNKE